MRSSSYYPVLQTQRVTETAAFYCRHFRFKPAFETDWYVHLQSTESDRVALAILDANHDSIPVVARGRTAAGMLINFEVDDARQVHDRLRKEGLEVVQALRDESFGQRHFILADPNGVLIDVVEEIPPGADFAAHFSAEAPPR